MAIKGDFQALQRLAKKMGQMQSAAFREYIGQRLGAAALKQVADEFRDERDPYGNAWAPLKMPRQRQGTRDRGGRFLKRDRILQDTGRLRASFGTHSTATGFSITTDVDYARYPQKGTRTAPRRQIVPEQGTGGIGPIWAKAFNREAGKAMREFFKKS